jgi:hypothetical protein
MTWTFQELDERFLIYCGAVRRRDLRLLRLGLVLLFIGPFLFVLGLSGHAGFTFSALRAWLAALVSFGTYVLLSSAPFQNAHAVRCPQCGTSLTELCMDLDPEERDGPLPEEIRCPACATLVARGAT